MWPLERLAKHKDLGKEILERANSLLGVGLHFTSVNKVAIYLETQRQTAIREQETREINNPIFEQDTGYDDIPIFLQKLEEMIEQYQKEAKKIKQSQDNLKLPYIEKLIAEGLLYSDGIRATGKLDRIAEFLVDTLEMDISFRFLQTTFLQGSYKEWSDSAVEVALQHGNIGRKKEKP